MGIDSLSAGLGGSGRVCISANSNPEQCNSKSGDGEMLDSVDSTEVAQETMVP